LNAPFVCRERRVESAWIDYNGHMNMAYYNVVFDQALDEVFDDLGIGAAYVKSGGGSCFTVEVHVTYVQEVKLGDSLRVTYQLLDWDAKRLHLFASMYNALEGYLAATSEHLVARRHEHAQSGRVAAGGAEPHRIDDEHPPPAAVAAASGSQDRDTEDGAATHGVVGAVSRPRSDLERKRIAVWRLLLH
jgi:acyl-CoA thioesterase FadM